MWIIPILSYSLLYWLSCCGSPCPHKRPKKIILGRCGPLPSCLFSAWCRVVVPGLKGVSSNSLCNQGYRDM